MIDERKNIVFLDIDGVLNSEEYYIRRHQDIENGKLSYDELRTQYPYFEIDNLAVTRLNRIVEECDAEIVISSTWRLNRTPLELQRILETCGFKGIVLDKTEHLGGVNGYTVPRGCEIEKWLKSQKFQRINWSREKQEQTSKESYIRNYIILDDDSDMLLSQKEHFIHTSFKKGLTDQLTDSAITTLNKNLVDLYYEK